MTDLAQKQKLVDELVNSFESDAEVIGTLKSHLAWALTNSLAHKQAAIEVIHQTIGKPISKVEQAIQFNERQLDYAIKGLAYATIDSVKEHYTDQIFQHSKRIADLETGDYHRFTSPELISMNGSDWAKENLGRDS